MSKTTLTYDTNIKGEFKMVNLVLTFEKVGLAEFLESFGTEERTYIFDYDSTNQIVWRLLGDLVYKNTVANIRSRLLVSKGGEMRLFDIENIYCVEAFGRMKYISASSGEFGFYARWSQVKQILEKYGFVRIHRSYAVSINHIKMVVDGCVVMRDDKRLSIGATYLEHLKDVLKDTCITIR